MINSSAVYDSMCNGTLKSYSLKTVEDVQSSSITLDSLDTKSEIVDKIFDDFVNLNNESKIETNPAVKEYAKKITELVNSESFDIKNLKPNNKCDIKDFSLLKRDFYKCGEGAAKSESDLNLYFITNKGKFCREESFNELINRLGCNKKQINCKKKEERRNKSSGRDKIKNESLTRWIDPDEIKPIRYSQYSIDNKTQEGMELSELFQNMSANGWKKETSIAVVVMPDGKLTSLDNRRLYTAKKIINTFPEKEFKIKITEWKADTTVPKRLLQTIIHNYAVGGQLHSPDQLPPSIQVGTYAQAILLRANTREGNLQSGNYGFENDPIIRPS
ncbi:MAG: hypothetical protein S4CHLAM123_05060 [Chlamydiales bacterium]|nr:hypothetical protein [Chlamydiales bacterium]